MKNGNLQSNFVKRGQSFFLLSFACLITSGMVLLKLPGMYGGGKLSWLDSLFTATSAAILWRPSARRICMKQDYISPSSRTISQ